MGRFLHKEQVNDCNTEVSTTSCCVASFNDWRVILNFGCCFLWNSTSHQKVQLSKITTKLHSRSRLLQPKSTVRSSFSFRMNPTFFIAKLVLLVGLRATTLDTHNVFVLKPFFCNGKIFSTVQNCKLLLELDPWSESCRPTSITSKEEEIDVDPIKQTFVEGGGEFFIVQRFWESKLEIYKLDFSCVRWVKVQNLGNLVFVLCSLHLFSLDAEDLGVQGNCVYLIAEDFESLYLFNLGAEFLSIIQNCTDSRCLWLSLEGQVPVLSLSDNATAERQEKALKVNGVGGLSKNDEITEDDNSIFHLLPSSVVGEVAKCLGGGVGWRLDDDSTTASTMPYPWLMSLDDQAHDMCKFYDPRDNATYRMETPEFPPDCVNRYAQEGWILATHGENSVFLFELFTKEEIQLTDLPSPVGYMTLPACISLLHKAPSIIGYLASVAISRGSVTFSSTTQNLSVGVFLLQQIS